MTSNVSRATRFDDLPDVLTVEETAAYLGIGRNGGYELVRTDRLPHFRLGRRVLISKAALAGLIEGMRHPQAT